MIKNRISSKPCFITEICNFKHLLFYFCENLNTNYALAYGLAAVLTPLAY